MGQDSKIEWTHHTFNPWWGCVRVSPACEHCYAEAFAKRTGHTIWGPPQTTPRRLFGPKHWAAPLKWNAKAAAAGERHRVFCASMADVFEDHPQVAEARDCLWQLIDATPHLDWLLLTKRPENIAAMLPWRVVPRPNVWLGTTVENQQWAAERIPPLLAVPAVVRFLSCEPLLGPLDLERWLVTYDSQHREPWALRGELHWVIAGGESGPHHRPLDLNHVRSLRDQCQESGAAFLFKQIGGRTPKAGGRLLDGRTWDQYPEPCAAVPA